MKRKISLILSVVFFLQSCLLVNMAEAHIWSERKNVRLASLPPSASPSFIPPANAPSRAARLNINKALFHHPGVPEWLQLAIAPYARILEVRSSRVPNAKTVVLMQDAHLQFEAQTNIAGAIDALARSLKNQNQTLLIGAEGSSAARADFSSYNAIPQRKLLREVAREMVRKNVLNGIELAVIGYQGETGEGPVKPPMTVVGLEDGAAYERNVDALRAAVPLRASVKKALKEFRRRLTVLKTERYTPALREWDAKLASYQSGELSVADYVLYLDSIRPATSPALKNLIEAALIEGTIDFKKVERERGRMLAALARRLSAGDTWSLLSLSALYKTGHVTYGHYFDYLKIVCRRNGISFADYPEMNLYVQYVLKSEGIDASTLFAELNRLEENVLSTLAKTPEQWRIAERSKLLHLQSKLVDHALSEEEWKQYNEISNFGFSIINDEGSMRLKPFEEFYKAAVDRNKIMSGRLAKALATGTETTAVLVAGGFHTGGLARDLARRDLNVVVVSPNITKVEKDAPSSLDFLASGRMPLDRMFRGDRLFVPVPFATTTTANNYSIRLFHLVAVLLRALLNPFHVVKNRFFTARAAMKTNSAPESKRRQTFRIEDYRVEVTETETPSKRAGHAAGETVGGLLIMGLLITLVLAMINFVSWTTFFIVLGVVFVFFIIFSKAHNNRPPPPRTPPNNGGFWTFLLSAVFLPLLLGAAPTEEISASPFHLAPVGGLLPLFKGAIASVSDGSFLTQATNIGLTVFFSILVVLIPLFWLIALAALGRRLLDKIFNWFRPSKAKRKFKIYKPPKLFSLFLTVALMLGFGTDAFAGNLFIANQPVAAFWPGVILVSAFIGGRMMVRFLMDRKEMRSDRLLEALRDKWNYTTRLGQRISALAGVRTPLYTRLLNSLHIERGHWWLKDPEDLVQIMPVDSSDSADFKKAEPTRMEFGEFIRLTVVVGQIEAILKLLWKRVSSLTEDQLAQVVDLLKERNLKLPDELIYPADLILKDVREKKLIDGDLSADEWGRTPQRTNNHSVGTQEFHSKYFSFLPIGLAASAVHGPASILAGPMGLILEQPPVPPSTESPSIWAVGVWIGLIFVGWRIYRRWKRKREIQALIDFIRKNQWSSLLILGGGSLGLMRLAAGVNQVAAWGLIGLFALVWFLYTTSIKRPSAAFSLRRSASDNGNRKYQALRIFMFPFALAVMIAALVFSLMSVFLRGVLGRLKRGPPLFLLAAGLNWWARVTDYFELRKEKKIARRYFDQAADTLKEAGQVRTALVLENMVKMVWPDLLAQRPVNPLPATAVVTLLTAQILTDRTFTTDQIKIGVIAALLHDIGLAASDEGRIRKSDLLAENRTSRAIEVLRTHKDVGAARAVKYLDAYNRKFQEYGLSFEERDIEQISELIRAHDDPEIQRDLDTNTGEWLFKLSDPLLRLRLALRTADLLWRVTKGGIEEELRRDRLGAVKTGKPWDDSREETLRRGLAKTVAQTRSIQEEADLYREAFGHDGYKKYGFFDGFPISSERGYELFKTHISFRIMEYSDRSITEPDTLERKLRDIGLTDTSLPSAVLKEIIRKTFLQTGHRSRSPVFKTILIGAGALLLIPATGAIVVAADGTSRAHAAFSTLGGWLAAGLFLVVLGRIAAVKLSWRQSTVPDLEKEATPELIPKTTEILDRLIPNPDDVEILSYGPTGKVIENDPHIGKEGVLTLLDPTAPRPALNGTVEKLRRRLGQKAPIVAMGTKEELLAGLAGSARAFVENNNRIVYLNSGEQISVPVVKNLIDQADKEYLGPAGHFTNATFVVGSESEVLVRNLAASMKGFVIRFLLTKVRKLDVNGKVLTEYRSVIFA